MSGDPKKLDFIDALRGIAVLGVIFTHAIQHTWQYGKLIKTPFEQLLYNFFLSGMYGVQLFFIVSAFTMLNSHESRVGETKPALKFFLRRFFRIAPMFYLGIAMYIPVFSLAGYPPLDWWAYPLTALFAHGFSYEHINTVVAGGWSIGVEFTFYAIFPLLALMVKTLAQAVTMLILSLGLCLGAAAFSGWMKWELVEYGFAYFWFPNQLFVFAVGFVVFFAMKVLPGGRFERIAPIGLAVTSLGLIALACWKSSTILSHVPLVLLMGVWVPCIALLQPRALVNAFFIAVGKLSFSIYIFHFAVIIFLGKVLQKASLEIGNWFYFGLLCGLTLMISMALSTLSLKYIEKPCQGWGRRLIQKLG